MVHNSAKLTCCICRAGSVQVQWLRPGEKVDKKAGAVSIVDFVNQFAKHAKGALKEVAIALLIKMTQNDASNTEAAMAICDLCEDESNEAVIVELCGLVPLVTLVREGTPPQKQAAMNSLLKLKHVKEILGAST